MGNFIFLTNIYCFQCEVFFYNLDGIIFNKLNSHRLEISVAIQTIKAYIYKSLLTSKITNH